MTAADEKPVITDVRNTTGGITLNRPRALNSLNPEMVTIIADALDAWRDDASVTQILIHSASEKAFCAGGDVRWARDKELAGESAEADEFFAAEYAMNEQIAKYPKPFVAVLDGVVMGGGVGISLHGSHRVVTDKAFMAMPEMNIGFVTDVAAGFAAQRAVGTRGTASPAVAKFWAITGYRQYAADMLWTGLATHYVDDAEATIRAIIDRGVDAALYDAAPGDASSSDAPLAALAPVIEETFSHATWQDISAAVRECGDEDFIAQVEKLTAQAAPASLVAAAELLCAEEQMDDVREALDAEKRLGEYMRRRRDFAEGVRAVLVDKRPDADFDPSRADAVDPSEFRAALGV